jgi:hypothetical protein
MTSNDSAVTLRGDEVGRRGVRESEGGDRQEEQQQGRPARDQQPAGGDCCARLPVHGTASGFLWVLELGSAAGEAASWPRPPPGRVLLLGWLASAGAASTARAEAAQASATAMMRESRTSATSSTTSRPHPAQRIPRVFRAPPTFHIVTGSLGDARTAIQSLRLGSTWTDTEIYTGQPTISFSRGSHYSRPYIS